MNFFRFTSLFLLNIFSLLHSSKAATGDTILIQAMMYGSAQDTLVVFPDASVRFEKIYMYYTLKCNPAQNPACGEWDYLTYTYLFKPGTGERFEIGRYITPYGIGLDLGAGFTWIFDVSDYRPLLTDTVRITAGNWQELLDLKFVMIEGTPPRDVLKVENLWSGDFALSTFDATVTAKTVSLDPSASAYRIKTRTSGHGWDNPTNCAEFCPKMHSLSVDGINRFEWMLWDECAYNPLYPQGGTWLIDRAGWCPGDIVREYDWELTPYVTSGGNVLIDYDAEYDAHGNYILEVQLISYGEPNFLVDAAIEEIIAPTKADYHLRKNPVCNRPQVKIKNTGAETLTSLLITYGVEGGEPCYFLWEGELKFLESAIVELPRFNWNGLNPTNPKFYATVSFPNDKEDEYAYNNTARSSFVIPPMYPDIFFLMFKTNNAAQENSWTLTNDRDSILYSGSGFANNIIYRDTFSLQPGCYTFHLTDSGHDGVNWWFNRNQVGSGYVRFMRYGVSGAHITFEPDFGAEIYHEFTVGYQSGQSTENYECKEIIITSSSTNEIKKPEFKIYPNPASDILTLEWKNFLNEKIELRIYDLFGKKISEFTIQSSPGKYQLDISQLKDGIYFMMIQNGQHLTHHQFVVVR